MFKEALEMTLRHIKIFVAVCECGSVTGAAEKLYITQPAASLAITELEEFYGIKLFDRISKRLHITESGKQFLQYATHIVSLFNEMENGMKNWDKAGVLRVGASITIGNYVLPEIVQNFQLSHPPINIKAIIDNSKNIEDAVLKNDIDFGLIEGISSSPYLQSSYFMDDSLVLICSPDCHLTKLKKLDIEQLKNENFIMREQGSGGREIFEGILGVHGIEITPIWQSTSTQAIVRAVSKNLGISVLPYLLVKENIDRGEIVSVKMNDISLKRRFSIIHHKNKFLTNSAKDFIEMCKNNHFNLFTQKND